MPHASWTFNFLVLELYALMHHDVLAPRLKSCLSQVLSIYLQGHHGGNFGMELALDVKLD